MRDRSDFCLAIVSAATALALGGTAGAQVLSDGDFDGLTPGTAPDCGTPNGAWLFPQNYIDAGVCESVPEDFTVTETSEFDPDAGGNSLELNVDGNPGFLHLTNIFTRQLLESDGAVVTVAFDTFVPEKGRGGGTIYVGGDHGGGGFTNTTDRGPQVSWLSDGTIVYRDALANNVIVGAYPYGEWQSARLEIDLASDTFDMFWGPRGGELEQVGDNLAFRSAPLNHLDRLTVVHFGDTILSGRAYFDSMVVSVPSDECYPDCNGDTILDFFDFLCYLNAFDNQDIYADCEANGIFDFFDFLCYLNSFDKGC